MCRLILMIHATCRGFWSKVPPSYVSRETRLQAACWSPMSGHNKLLRPQCLLQTLRLTPVVGVMAMLQDLGISRAAVMPEQGFMLSKILTCSTCCACLPPPDMGTPVPPCIKPPWPIVRNDVPCSLLIRHMPGEPLQPRPPRMPALA